jgi:hypothetical protein
MALTGVAVSTGGPLRASRRRRANLTDSSRADDGRAESKPMDDQRVAGQDNRVRAAPRLTGGCGLRAATSAPPVSSTGSDLAEPPQLSSLDARQFGNIRETFGSEWRQQAALFRPSERCRRRWSNGRLQTDRVCSCWEGRRSRRLDPERLDDHRMIEVHLRLGLWSVLPGDLSKTEAVEEAAQPVAGLLL